MKYNFTITALKDIAGKLNIAVPKGIKKDALIDLLDRYPETEAQQTEAQQTDAPAPETEAPKTKAPKVKAPKTIKLRQKDMDQRDMDPEVFQILGDIEEVLDVKPHGKDGYTFTLQGKPRKRVFEIYRVPTGYTLWMPHNLAETIGLTKPNRVYGKWEEFKFDTEGVIINLLKMW